MSRVGVHTDKEPPHADISVSDLDACREELNEVVFSHLIGSDFAEDLTAQAEEDFRVSYMTEPQELNLEELKEVHFSRRMAVRERKFKIGAWVWRTVAVDHCTESGLNPATGLGEKLRHETLDVQIKILVMFVLRSGHRQFKRDLRKAFRGLPIYFRLEKYAWVVGRER